MSFARFMDLALYDPAGGYYSRSGVDRIGPRGDFVTASDCGSWFGRALARQLAEIDRRTGPHAPFDVVELGPGRGLLARDVLDALARDHPALATRVRYRLVERSAALREACRALVPEGETLAPEELGGGHRGALLAVELFDALPVRRLRRRGARLLEVRVGLDAAGGLAEVEVPAEDVLQELARRHGAAACDGCEAELAPAAGETLEAAARAFERGVFVIVDYGDDARHLYGHERAGGTLLAYHRHSVSRDYLERVGEQDLTAHVDFSALEQRAREIGLAVLGRTSQDRFLIANGVLEAFEPSRCGRDVGVADVKRRLQVLQLIHPAAMGRSFQVLLLAKGCDPPPALDGLRDPFARDGAGGR